MILIFVSRAIFIKGKIYVNKNKRTEWLNKRAVKHSALQIVDYLDIQSGDVIVDIGSGGWLAFEFSKLTGSNGLVIAADTDDSLS